MYIHLYLKFYIWALELELAHIKEKISREKKPALLPQTLTALKPQEILGKKMSLTNLAVPVVLFYWVILGESNTTHPFNAFTGSQCCNLWREFQSYRILLHHSGGKTYTLYLIKNKTGNKEGGKEDGYFGIYHQQAILG